MGVYIKPGYKIGRLTVRELAVDGNANQRRWLCDCECGGMNMTKFCMYPWTYHPEKDEWLQKDEAENG